MTLIEVVLAIGILVMLFGGIYSAYAGILDAVANTEARSAAAALVTDRFEFLKNLPYASVGVVGGFPAGSIPSVEIATTTNGYTFQVTTVVRNIDDPFDGTLGGSPNDTAPADYKMVELTIACVSCARFVPLRATLTIAPQNLESSATGGSLFIHAFDASANPIQGATVHVVNASVTPSIDLTDTTNNAGVLQLVGVPTSTQGYQITVSKDGYSSEKTYRIGDVVNPNPDTPHVTVAAATLTDVSFGIDRLSTTTIRATDALCRPIASLPFSYAGVKTIGTSPDVLKTNATGTLGSSGTSTLSLEWDTYTFAIQSSSYALRGFDPLLPLTIDPNTTHTISLFVGDAVTRGARFFVGSPTGTPILGASVSLSGGLWSAEEKTGYTSFTHTDWSGGNYESLLDADAEGTPGSVLMAGPPYSTSTDAVMVGPLVDLGDSETSFDTLAWTGSGDLRFQLATNNDGFTWNFVGPDGTPSSYYTISGTEIPASLGTRRYLRYKVFLRTSDTLVSPSLDSLTIRYRSSCIPQGTTFFSGMPADTYTVSVSAPGYTTATSTLSISSGVASSTILLTP
jgi:hypothetical protein